MSGCRNPKAQTSQLVFFRRMKRLIMKEIRFLSFGYILFVMFISYRLQWLWCWLVMHFFRWAVKTLCVICLDNTYLLWNLALDGEEKWKNVEWMAGFWRGMSGIFLQGFKGHWRSWRKKRLSFCFFLILFLELVRIVCEMEAQLSYNVTMLSSLELLLHMRK